MQPSLRLRCRLLQSQPLPHRLPLTRPQPSLQFPLPFMRTPCLFLRSLSLPLRSWMCRLPPRLWLRRLPCWISLLVVLLMLERLRLALLSVIMSLRILRS